jgi:uncharacterized protein YjbI with pentapeptide repeats
MANPEHLQILKQGVQAWNEWRNERPEIKVDLSSSMGFGQPVLVRRVTEPGRWSTEPAETLRKRDLARFNLSHVDLNTTDLRETILSEANLSGANLHRSSLRRANLRAGEGWLSRKPTVLRGADLTEAVLIEADLRGADLREADLSRAIFSETLIIDVNLAGAKGLESCEHRGPSTIDDRTIIKSRPLPRAFLQGCGLTDDLIDVLNRLEDFYSCFISYSCADSSFADRLYQDLRNRGLRCWYAPEDLKIGDRFQERIEESIHTYDKLVIVLSESSVQSRWVEREVNSAREREDLENGAVLFPIRIDEAVMRAPQPWAADIRRSRHIGNFSAWRDQAAYQQAVERLLRDLKASNRKS